MPKILSDHLTKTVGRYHHQGRVDLRKIRYFRGDLDIRGNVDAI